MATRTHPGGRAGALIALLITLVCAGWPLGCVLWSLFAGIFSGDISRTKQFSGLEPALTYIPAWRLLGSTITWGVGIGIGATLLAWPAAWLIRLRGWRILPLLLVPLMLPNYLPYSGYSTIRAAGTPLGNALASLVDIGWPDAPALAGRLLAGVGLALWAWPISAVVLGATFRRLDEQVLEALRLDAPPLRRLLQVVRISGFGIMSSIGLVALLMLGSAVPLHLAQVPTYAVKVWLDLTLSPGDWRIWLGAWPLMVLATLGAVVTVSAIARQFGRPDEAQLPPKKPVTGTRIASTIVWLLAVAVPLGLFIATVHGFKPYVNFWRTTSQPVLTSAGVAVGVGLVGVALAAAFWQGLSASGAGRLTPTLRLCLLLLMVTGLLPGVLTGAAVTTAITITPRAYDLGDSPLALVIAHTARFGFIAALLGCWLAAIEPRQERDLRALDAGLGLKSWLAACLPLQGGALAGIGLALASLSFHEIEAAVVVQPPGSPSLAQVMLNHLHQLRMQDVAAAAVSVVVMALLIALASAWAAGHTLRRTP